MMCPQCRAPMQANPAPDERTIVKAMVGRGSNAAYATNFARTHLEKQDTLGVLHTCGTCRYVMRVKLAA